MKEMQAPWIFVFTQKKKSSERINYVHKIAASSTQIRIVEILSIRQVVEIFCDFKLTTSSMHTEWFLNNPFSLLINETLRWSFEL